MRTVNGRQRRKPRITATEYEVSCAMGLGLVLSFERQTEFGEMKIRMRRGDLVVVWLRFWARQDPLNFKIMSRQFSNDI